MKTLSRLVPAIALLGACSLDQDPMRTLPLGPSFDASTAGAGQVYTASNAVAGNAVLIYDRGADGSLQSAGSVATGGTGTGSGLGNQGGVVLSGSGRVLLVVNAGSNSISSFGVLNNGSLELIDVEASGGLLPKSVSEHRGLVYVLNAGGSGN